MHIFSLVHKKNQFENEKDKFIHTVSNSRVYEYDHMNPALVRLHWIPVKYLYYMATHTAIMDIHDAITDIHNA